MSCLHGSTLLDGLFLCSRCKIVVLIISHVLWKHQTRCAGFDLATSDGLADNGDLGLSFLSTQANMDRLFPGIICKAPATPWLLPAFRGRVMYSARVGLSIALGAAWVLNSYTHSFFLPGLLIPIGAVSSFCRTVLVHRLFLSCVIVTL